MITQITDSQTDKSADLCSKGFALISTIIVMSLLLLISFGILGLSSIETRTSRGGQVLSEAQANARIALMLAVGELQKTMGPDQRISASSGILDSDTTTTEIDDVAQPHLTGVWNSWKWQPGDGQPDYAQNKEDMFVQWLTSHPDSDSVKDRDFAKQEPVNQIQILGEGTSSNPLDHVEASRVEIVNPDTGNEGAYAWAVFDEGQKARVSLSSASLTSLAMKVNHLVAPALPAYEAITEWSQLASAGNTEQSKILSINTLELLGIDPLDEDTFHALSPVAANLMTDVVDGRFSKDLNMVFDGVDLPDAFEDQYIYSGTNQPLAAAPNRFAGANPLPNPDPQWKLLHSHYRLFDRVEQVGNEFSVQASETERPQDEGELDSPFFTEQQLLPVVAKAQFVFSLSAGWHGALNSTGGRTDEDKYVSWLVTDPVITLWNPYNVSLRFSSSEIQLYRVPLTFSIYKNGSKVSQSPTHFANTFVNSDLNNRQNQFYRLNITPKSGESEIVIKPGEYKVFTAHTHAKHFRHEYATTGIDLRPGFNPPEGNESNESVGGVSTLNIMVDSSGGASGRLDNSSVRTLPLKAGDVMEVEVIAGKADIDSHVETDGREITSFMKFFQGQGEGKKLIGGVELDYNAQELVKNLPSYAKDELSNFVVSAETPEGVKADDVQGDKPPVSVRFKRPFLIASLHLKTEQDSVYPSRAWLQNSPINTYASSGIDQTESQEAQQYEFTWEPMFDWKDIPGVQLDLNDRGYGGSGLYSDSGVHVTPFASIPLVAPISMGQLRHAPLNTGGQLPLTSQIVGNSFACPLVERTGTATSGGSATYLDHSFLANTRLFDHYFFSSASSRSTSLHDTQDSLEEVLNEFFNDGKSLPNSRFVPYISSGVRSSEIASELVNNDMGYEEVGSHLLLNGAFNVNSTSLNAWKVFLASGTMSSIPVLDALTSTTTEATGSGTLASRFMPPTGEDLEATADPAMQDVLRWTGHRRLDSGQITELAMAAVEEVKKRGPFQSVAEFVNRRLENSELGLNGALQAAIDKSDLNGAIGAVGIDVVAGSAGFADSEAAVGNTTDGSPSAINQADILTPLAPFISVRSDTFRIRAYGESRGANGQVVKAWCEAVVQRMPDYIDSTTPASTPLTDLPSDGVNARFGRRMEIVSFRWLLPDEI